MTFCSNKYKAVKKLHFLAILMIFSSSFNSYGQTPKKPVSLDEITEFLRLPSATFEIRTKRLKEQIETRGVDFVFTRDVLNRLIKSGAKSHIWDSRKNLIDFIQQISLRGTDIFNKKIANSPSIDAQLNAARTKLKEGMRIASKENKNFATTYNQVKTLYTNAVNMNPESAELYYERTKALEFYSIFEYVDIDTIISDYTKVISLNPQFALAYYDRGLAYIRRAGGEKSDYYANSIKDYNEFIQLNPQFEKALDRDYAYIFFRNGQNLAINCRYYSTNCEEALTHLSKSIEIYYFSESVSVSLDSDEIYERRAIVYEKLKKYDEAIADQSYLGDSYLQNGDFNKSIESYSKAISLFPTPSTNPNAIRSLSEILRDGRKQRCLNARADAYEKIGRKDLAEADRVKAKQLLQK